MTTSTEFHSAMTDAINEEHSSSYGVMRDVIRCNDGFNISIQCGSGLYCNPREGDGRESVRYMSFELGYPSTDKLPSNIKDLAEDHNDYTRTVYGYIIIRDIIEMIDMHGGLKGSGWSFDIPPGDCILDLL